eukprot:1950471-Pyramimonas_sp.AAC.1
MCEDFLAAAQRQHPAANQDLWEERARGAALRDIQTQLRAHRKTLADFGLPAAPPAPAAANAMTDVEAAERRWDPAELRERVERLELDLNVQQRAAYDAVLGAVRGATPGGGFFFVDAVGGCGKTFLLSLMLDNVRMHGDIAIACATSGLASLLLQGGTTAHSRFKLPLDIGPDSVSAMAANSEQAAVLRSCKLIVWDEAPMAHRYALE